MSIDSLRNAPPARVRAFAPKLAGAAPVAISAVFLFGLGADHDLVPRAIGYSLLAVGLLLAYIVDRGFALDLGIIVVGVVIVSTIRLEADISVGNMALMGTVLTLAVVVPRVLSGFVHHGREQPIRFPVLTGRRWTWPQWVYLAVAVAAGWAILPFYFLTSGAYLNWPAVTEGGELIRLFIGVNAVGIWDELFFICTVFALFRRHFPVWIANLLQATIFVSFLWELGYQGWGPLITIPFALVQAVIFLYSKSLTYVVSVHLLFDLVVFLVIVHAHNPGALPIFVY